MEKDGRPIVGILGGLGPWATLDLFRRILELTPAERDQDHLHLIIENNPAVPDRTAAILGHGEDPLPALMAGARRLAAAGADFIAMPCNTACHWMEPLAAAVDIPFIDMVGEAVDSALGAVRGLRRVGLLATTGTIRSGVYARRFAAHGVEVLAPDEAAQRDLVMASIQDIKAGRRDALSRDRLAEAGRRLVQAGAQVLIAACTEVPLVLRAGDVAADHDEPAKPVPLVDTLDCLARAVVSRATSASTARARKQEEMKGPPIKAHGHR